MEYEELKKEILEIAKIANEAPAPFKEKCFELLLSHLLSGTPSSPIVGPPKAGPGEGEGTVTPSAQLRVFMKKYDVTNEHISKVIMRSENDVHLLKEPEEKKVAKGQIAWALLLALKNGILKNKFEVDPEDVRSICIEKGYYHKANFASYFKTPGNAKLFKGAMESQGEPQALSDKGMEKLAELIKKLAG